MPPKFSATSTLRESRNPKPLHVLPAHGSRNHEGWTGLPTAEQSRMPYEPLIDPQYWRDRAEETLAKASQMHDLDNKLTMLKIAEGHYRQAVLMERLRDRPADNSPGEHARLRSQR
jgi:hypothetical protein